MTIFQTVPGGSPSVSTTSGGKVYSFNDLDTTPQEVAPANPTRQKITFHNPGATDLYVAPATVVNTGLAVPLVPSPSALGGCFLVFANGGTLVIEGECQTAWQAFSASGSDNPMTVMDSNL